MSEFGHYTLCIAWLLSLLGFIGGAYAGHYKKREWFLTVRNSTMLVGVCAACSIFALCYSFVTDDYSNQYVWQFSNKAMDTVYKISATWGGMDGSMLLWAFILSVSSAVVAFLSIRYPRALMPWVLCVINSSLLFFLSIIVFYANPFRHIKAPFIPPDGNGLNPLLQNPYMAIHPPMLYAGFTLFSIPFAFCLGALLAGELSNEWIRLTRRWTLIAWGFLTVGIVLGGHWAYTVLGWGGFWAWDPVENASFMPWLTGTAFLHSVMVQERKNMLKLWNVWLIVLTYALTVFGTFLTRSGIVQSVHAFASTDIGGIFLSYLAFVFIASIALTTWRRSDLRSERKIESLFSREAAFLVNNLLFLSICFATLWGVMFPVLSEAVTGVKQTTGIPFFNAVNIPLFLLMIFMMGVGPLIAWRKASIASLRKTFLLPFVLSFAIAAILVWAGITEFYPILTYSICFFVLLTILGEIHRGVRVQTSTLQNESKTVGENFGTLLRRHKIRYGGYLVHFGVLVVTIGITASMAHKVEKEFTLGRNGSYDIGRFRLTLDTVEAGGNSNYEFTKANLTVRSRADGEVLGKLDPELRFYLRNKETTSQVSLRKSIREDLYLVLAGVDDEKGSHVSFKVFINPLQMWLWVGVVIMVIGTLIVIFSRQGEALERASERVGARVPQKA